MINEATTKDGLSLHTYPAAVSANVGNTLIYKALIEATNAALDFKEAGSKGEAPRFLIMTTTGSGKTKKALEKIRDLLKKNPFLKILFLTTSTGDSEERQKDAVEVGIPEDLAFVWRGRSQPAPDGEGDMCRKSALAELLASMNIEVAQTLCRGKDKHGREVECEHAATCPYLAQMQAVGKDKGGIVFASHQYLSVKAEAFKNFDIVVIDENPLQTLYSTKRVDMGRFTTWRGPGEDFRRKKGESAKNFESRIEDEAVDMGIAIEDFKNVIETAFNEGRAPLIEDFLAAGITAEIARHMGNMEYTRIPKVEIDAGMREEMQWSLLDKKMVREAFGFARVWRCLEIDLNRASSGPLFALDFRWGEITDRAKLPENNIVCNWHRTPNFSDKPTIILDASAPVGAYRKFWPGIEITEVNIEYKNVETTQCADWTGSMTSIKTEGNKQDIHNFMLATTHRLADEIGGRPERAPVLISTKAVIESLQNDLKKMGVGFMWYGNTRGKNAAKFASSVVIQGRLLPSAKDIEDMARAIYGDDQEPLVLLKPDEKGNLRFPTEKLLMIAKDGSEAIVDVPTHPDPRVRELLHAVVYGELDQAIGRGRFIYRGPDNRCELVVNTNVPLRFQPDRFVKKAEIMPDRFDLAYMAGFVPETYELMARLFPDMFPSAGAVRAAACRREARAFPLFAGCYKSLYNNKYHSVTHARVSLTLEEMGSREQRLAVRLRHGDTAQKVRSRVLAVFPDAEIIDVALPTPEISESVRERAQTVAGTPTTGRDKATGFLKISQGTLALFPPIMDCLIWSSFKVPDRYKSANRRI